MDKDIKQMTIDEIEKKTEDKINKGVDPVRPLFGRKI